MFTSKQKIKSLTASEIEAYMEDLKIQIFSVTDMKSIILQTIIQNYGELYTSVRFKSSKAAQNHPKRSGSGEWFKIESFEHLIDLSKEKIKIEDISIIEHTSVTQGGPGSEGKRRMKDFIIKLAKAKTYIEICEAIYDSNVLQGENGKTTIFLALCESFKIENIYYENEERYTQQKEIDEEDAQQRYTQLYADTPVDLFSKINNTMIILNYIRSIAPIFMRELVHTELEKQYASQSFSEPQLELEANDDSMSDDEEDEQEKTMIDKRKKILLQKFPPLEEWELNTRLTIVRDLSRLVDNISEYMNTEGYEEASKLQRLSAYVTNSYQAPREFIAEQLGDKFEILSTYHERCKTGSVVIMKIESIKEAIYNRIDSEYAKIIDENGNAISYQQSLNGGEFCLDLKSSLPTLFGGSGQKGAQRVGAFLGKLVKKEINTHQQLADVILSSKFTHDSKAYKCICDVIAENIYVPMAANNQYKNLSELAESCNFTQISSIFREKTVEIINVFLIKIAGVVPTEANVEEYIADRWRLPVFISRKQKIDLEERAKLNIDFDNHQNQGNERTIMYSH